MMADDYEIIPKSDIELLKQEIENIKKDPLKNSPTDLKSSIIELNSSIKSLMKIFSMSARKLSESPVSESTNDDKFEKIESQNRDIAKALISIGESLNEFKSEMRELKEAIHRLKEDDKPTILRDKPREDEVGSFWKQPQKSFPPNNVQRSPSQSPQAPVFPQQRSSFPPIDQMTQTINQRRELRDNIPQFKPNMPPSMPPPPPPKRK